MALDYQSMSACKQISMMGSRRSFPSTENIAPHINYVYGSSGGLLQAPLPPHLLNLYRQLQQQQQPPLLPLPLHQSLPTRTRSQSLTPKKPKSKRSNIKKPQQKDMNNSISSSSGGIIMASTTTRLGPDPSDLPKDVTKVLSSKTTLIGGGDGDMDNFSSSIFTLAPPPSSLPLPRFSSLKQQPRLIGCKAAAAAGGGVDAGATDNLCRLLRLR